MNLSEQAEMKKVLEAPHKNHSKTSVSLQKTALTYLNNFPCSRNWINSLKSSLTRQRYAKNLYRFCCGVKLHPNELLKLKIDQTDILLMTEKERQELRKNFDKKFAEHILENYLVEAKFKDLLAVKNAVVSFYKYNDKALAHNVAQNIQQKDKPIEAYRLPTIEDVEAIAKATATLRDEALIWLIQSTGMRRGTINQLTFGDLQECRYVDGKLTLTSVFETDKKGELDDIAPIMLRIGSKRLKGKYKNVIQTTFLHYLAFQKLQQYTRWLQVTYKITVDKKTPLFVILKKPFTALSYAMMGQIIRESCVNAFGNGKIFSLHDLRRFAQTSLESARVSPNWIKRMQAKKLSKEQAPYSLPQLTQLHQAFKSAISYFVPSNQPKPQAELFRQVQKQNKTITKQQTLIKKQTEILKQLQKDFEPLKQQAHEQADLSKQIIETIKQHPELIKQLSKIKLAKKQQQ